MKRIAAFLLFSVMAFATGPARVTITDTLYDPAGNLLNGTVAIENASGFTSPDGFLIPAFSRLVVKVTNGALSVSLVPNVGSSPTGTSYSISYDLRGYAYPAETWVVPNTPGTTQALSGVRTLVAPIPSTQFASSQLNPPSPCTAAQVMQWSGTAWQCATVSGGGSAYATIQNAASAIAQRSTLNWLADISCADNSGQSRSDCALTALGTAGTYTKVTTDSKGRVSAGMRAASVDLGDFSTTAPTTAGKIPIYDPAAANAAGGSGAYVPGDPLVQGLYADGSTSAANPVAVGGYDTAGTPALHRATFLNGNPAGTEYGIVTRPIPNGTQTVSVSNTPAVASAQLPAALDGSGFIKTHEQGTATVAGTVTANAGTNMSTAALAVETGGNLAAIKTDVDKIPASPSTDRTTAAAPFSTELSDGAAFYTAAKTGQLPTALDGSGFLKTHEQGTATVTGAVTANVGTTNGLALDASVTGLEVSQGSTTSGQKGVLIQGAVTTNAPTDTTAQTAPLSLDTAGLARVSLKDTPQNTNAFKVDGSAVTQPVSAASLPLPSGAATAAKQPALGTAGTPSADVITVQGSASMTAVKVDGSAATQPVSCTAANCPVNVSQIGATAVVNGGVAGSLSSGGTAANNAAPTQNPDLIGAETITPGSDPTLATSGNQRRVLADTAGSIFVRTDGPHAFSCQISLTTNTTTQCQAAPAAGLRAYVTSYVFATTTAGTATTVKIQFGTGAACVTGTTQLSAAIANVAIGTSSWQDSHGLVPTAANAICATQAGTTAGTTNVQITGFIAP